MGGPLTHVLAHVVIDGKVGWIIQKSRELTPGKYRKGPSRSNSLIEGTWSLFTCACVCVCVCVFVCVRVGGAGEKTEWQKCYIFRPFFILSPRNMTVPCYRYSTDFHISSNSSFFHGQMRVTDYYQSFLFSLLSLTVVNLWPFGAPCRVYMTKKGSKGPVN